MYGQGRPLSVVPRLQELVDEQNTAVSAVQRLAQAQEAMHALLDKAGVELVFAPEVPPEARDYLVTSLVNALDGAFFGAGLGLAIGTLVNSVDACTRIGLLVGAMVGLQAGIDAVGGGWRVRVMLPDGPSGTLQLEVS